MSIKGRIFGTVVGAAGLAAAAGAVGIARQNRIIGNRAAGERVAFGELHSAPRAAERPELDLLAGGPVADDPALPGDADGAGRGSQAGRSHDGAEDAALDAHRVSSLSTWRRASLPPIRVTTS